MRVTQIIGLKSIIFLMMFFSITVSVGIAYAETRYVSDVLVITIREGKGNEYKVIKTLQTNAPLEVLEESEQHLKVRTKSGIEGWVLTQYVTRKTPKPVVIVNLKNKIDRLNTKIDQYKKDNGSLQDKLKTAKSDHNKKIKEVKKDLSSSTGTAEQTAKELKKITEKYYALLKESKDVINLVKERDNLKASNSEFQAETEQLQEENARLERNQMIWWFIAGGAVFFLGWIIGKISRQKRFY